MGAAAGVGFGGGGGGKRMMGGSSREVEFGCDLLLGTAVAPASPAVTPAATLGM